MTSRATTSATSSPASAGGATRCDSRDGPTTGQSGPAPVPVSRFRALDSEKAMPIEDTSGPLFSASSPSATLQRSLESRLHRLLDASGSPEYALTWSTWDMPAGPPICRLRASARRTSGNGSGGWPTPTVTTGTQHKDSPTPKQTGGTSLAGAAGTAGWPTPNAGPQNDLDTKWQERRAQLAEKYGNNGFGLTLGMAAQLSGWATPTTNPRKRSARFRRGRRQPNPEELAGWPSPTESMGGREPSGKTGRKLATIAGWATPRSVETGHSTGNPERALNHKSRIEDQAYLAGWATPTTRDHKDGASDLTNTPVDGLRGRQAISFHVPTEKRGALNPAFSRWLMGFPVEWCLLAPFCKTETVKHGSEGMWVVRTVPTGHEGRAAQEVLLAYMHGRSVRENASAVGAEPSTVPFCGHQVRALPRDEAPSSSSPRSQSAEQPLGKHPDSLREMPRRRAPQAPQNIEMRRVQGNVRGEVPQVAGEDLFCPVCDRVGPHQRSEEMGPARVGRLRAYGNAIVPQVAAVFIRAFIEGRTVE